MANAADVRLFGVSTPETGQWAVFAQITNAASAVAPGAQVAGLSSIGISLVDQPGATVTGATNTLPRGNTPYVDSAPPFNNEPLTVRYGFWLPTSPSQQGPANGSVGAEPVPAGTNPTGRTGAWGIAGAQDPFSETPGIPYERLVLPGVGLVKGSKSTNADYTTPTAWGAPVQIAKGTYTPAGPTSVAGLKIEYFTDVVNLVRDVDPSAAINWDLETAVGTTVVSAKSFTTGALVSGNTTVRAGPGDSNLDGNVDFNDLVTLAQNYNTPTGMTWFDGDNNYDGAVDFNDLVGLAQNYNSAVPASGLPASFASDVAAAFAQVPEPGSFTIIGAATAGMLLRRRRR
jgi:hypothetical protein